MEGGEGRTLKDGVVGWCVCKCVSMNARVRATGEPAEMGEVGWGWGPVSRLKAPPPTPDRNGPGLSGHHHNNTRSWTVTGAAVHAGLEVTSPPRFLPLEMYSV